MYTRRTFLRNTLAFFLFACSNPKTHKALPKGAKVSALGDSLTAGFGAPKGADFPTQLARLTEWNIDNDGISGDKTEDILARLERVFNKQPQLILLGIGGNDFLRRVPIETTQNHLNQIITRITQNHIPLVLIAEPHLTAAALLTGQLSDHPIYAELAKQHQLPLFGEAWSNILSDKSLKSDQIHANAKGYQQFAQELFDFLKKQGFCA